MSAKEDAAREAAIFDGMLPNWYRAYVVSDLWNIILLRRDADIVEHLAREVTSRLLSDDFRKTMREASHALVYRRRNTDSQQGVSAHEKD